MEQNTSQPSPANHVTVRLDFRIVSILLLVVIAAMLVIWKPWQESVNAKDRTITVTGSAGLKAAPDEFAFSPSYQFTNSDQQAALKDLTAKSNDVVGKLKSLGVADKNISTNASSWAYPVYDNGMNSAPTYTLYITVTVDDKTLAQKVEDYLVTTSPTGTLTPAASFSTATEKSLQSQARDKATQDARSKAEQSAKNLGFKLAAVKTVDDSAGFGGGIRPLMSAGSTQDVANGKSSSLTVQPGENTLDYSVTVTYYIH